jgi:GMP synthase-like glutamine amidotransferase
MSALATSEKRPNGVGIARGSVLFISAHIAPDHENYGMYRPNIDPPPDYDLNRLIETAGGWTRQFFCREIVDAPSDNRVYPKDPAELSAIVVGGSLHFWSAARGPLAAWQEELVSFVVKSILEWDLGYLGLCAGGQIGLRALGGTVEPNPADAGSAVDTRAGDVLVRTGELVLMEAGSNDPIFVGCPQRFSVQESHADYLAGIPEDVIVLAESTDLPHQVLGWHDRVRLFQPHPELSLSLMRRVLHESARRASSPAETRRLEQISARLRETRVANQRIVPNFLRML